jgi:hypothetical protein
VATIDTSLAILGNFRITLTSQPTSSVYIMLDAMGRMGMQPG